MSKQRTWELANYLATELPREGNQPFDERIAAARRRWPGLSDAEVQWALIAASVALIEQTVAEAKSPNVKAELQRGLDQAREMLRLCNQLNN